jgi:hypothetical protein
VVGLGAAALGLARTCVILNGHICSLTWADVDAAYLGVLATWCCPARRTRPPAKIH